MTRHFFLLTAVGLALAGCGEPGVVDAQVQNDFASLRNALDLYRLNGGRYPTTEQGLAALVERPTTEPAPKMWTKISDRVPLDPWGTPYHYRWQQGDEADTETFLLWSSGRDQTSGTKDDILAEIPPPRPMSAP